MGDAYWLHGPPQPGLRERLLKGRWLLLCQEALSDWADSQAASPPLNSHCLWGVCVHHNPLFTPKLSLPFESYPMTCFWKVCLYHFLPSTSKKKPLGFFIRIRRATSTISESEGSVRLLRFNSYCMSPGSKRPADVARIWVPRACCEDPKEPRVCPKGYKTPYTQLGIHIGGALHGRLCTSGNGFLVFILFTAYSPGAWGLQPHPNHQGYRSTAHFTSSMESIEHLYQGHGGPQPHQGHGPHCIPLGGRGLHLSLPEGRDLPPTSARARGPRDHLTRVTGQGCLWPD